MGFFSKLRRKESSAAKTIVANPGQAVWTPRDYKSFAAEGYQKNVVAYKAISSVANAVASVRWTVWRGEDELLQHPVIDLLQNPNPLQSLPDILRAKVGFLLISGNSYDERIVVGGQAKEIYTLRPDRMTIIPSNNGIPSKYIYKVGFNVATWEVADDLSCDLRHMKSFNPLDDWYGMSPIEAGAFAIDQHNESMQWMQSLIQNSARPSGAMEVKEGEPLTDEQYYRLKTEIQDVYSGAKNAGRPLILEGGLKWQQMGLSPTDMGIIEAKYSSARDVALAFGVPPQMLGIPGDNTYSNYAEARLAFWEDTVIPLVDMIAADWTQWLGDGEVTIKPDLDQIPAIADKRMTLWDMADKSTDLTINERRELKGYKPITGGDILPIQSAQRTPQIDSQALKALAYGR